MDQMSDEISREVFLLVKNPLVVVLTIVMNPPVVVLTIHVQVLTMVVNPLVVVIRSLGTLRK